VLSTLISFRIPVHPLKHSKAIVTRVRRLAALALLRTVFAANTKRCYSGSPEGNHMEEESATRTSGSQETARRLDAGPVLCGLLQNWYFKANWKRRGL
jgi:hypothetical protein